MAIRIPIISEFDDKGLARATRQFRELETTGQKAQFAIRKAAVPATLAIGGLALAAGDAFKAFAEDEAAANKLALSLKNSTKATDAQVAAVEDFISSTSKAAAVADDDLRPALDSLVRGTKDVAKSQELLQLALDISAGTGKELTAVTDALSKAYNGNLTSLQKLDPSLRQLVKSGADTDEVFKALGNTFGGQAAAQAQTAEGQMRNLSIQMGELKESVGAAVAPIVQKLLPAFSKIATWISENTGLVVGLGVAIGSVALAVWGANAALTAWNAITKITAALNAVLGTSFSALWVATGVGIIAAIIAAVVLLNEKFQFMDNVINFVKEAFSGFYKAVRGYIDALYLAFKNVFNSIANLWNNTIGKLSFKVPSWVPIFGGRSWSVPKIPLLAEGGIVTGPTLAMIGEKGPEAVIPLDRMMRGNITVNVAGTVTSERDLVETIRKGLVDAQRNGAQLVYSNT
jgi:hypothetical protein